MATAEERRAAVAQVIGAMSYALLRSFQVTARGATSAPTIALADRQASFAAGELERYRSLSAHLAALTDTPDEVTEVFRKAIDAFYEAAHADGWIQTQVFHFVGNTLTNDYAEIIATHLDPASAEAVQHALTARTEQEAFALEQITAVLESEGDAGQERIRRFAGAMVGEALNAFREALEASNAIEVVLGGPDGVKAMVLELLGRHRERLERLGVDTLDD
jgi:hypothetical protein